jgi:cytochrome c553
VKRILCWAGRLVAGFVAVAIFLAIGVYLISERAIRHLHEVPFLDTFVVRYDADAVAQGKHLATIYGCFNSCHGDRMQGARLLDEPALGRFNAPNLTKVLPEYTDVELERLIRRGVKRDGTTTWAMPSLMFSRLSDEDLANIIAFVRTVPTLEGPMREMTFGPLARLGIATGKFKPHASTIEPGLAHTAKTNRSDPIVFGEYLVMTTCTECHGQNLQGDDFMKAPGLTVMSGYSDEAFRRLMKTGIAVGGRKLGLMTEMGVTRFPSLTDEELDAMSAFLKRKYGGGTSLAAEAPNAESTAVHVDATPEDRS